MKKHFSWLIFKSFKRGLKGLKQHWLKWTLEGKEDYLGALTVQIQDIKSTRGYFPATATKGLITRAVYILWISDEMVAYSYFFLFY